MSTDGQRLEVLEDGMQRLWDILDAEERLSKRVHGLRDDVQALSDVVEQVQQNKVELRTVGDGLRAVRAAALDTKRAAARRIGALTVVVVLGIFGTVVTGWWAHTARVAATQVRDAARDAAGYARQLCEDRNAVLQATITRERHLAAADVPATRAAHAASVAASVAQLRVCAEVYPIPGR